MIKQPQKKFFQKPVYQKWNNKTTATTSLLEALLWNDNVERLGKEGLQPRCSDVFRQPPQHQHVPHIPRHRRTDCSMITDPLVQYFSYKMMVYIFNNVQFSYFFVNLKLDSAPIQKLDTI